MVVDVGEAGQRGGEAGRRSGGAACRRRCRPPRSGPRSATRRRSPGSRRPSGPPPRRAAPRPGMDAVDELPGADPQAAGVQVGHQAPVELAPGAAPVGALDVDGLDSAGDAPCARSGSDRRRSSGSRTRSTSRRRGRGCWNRRRWHRARRSLPPPERGPAHARSQSEQAQWRSRRRGSGRRVATRAREAPPASALGLVLGASIIDRRAETRYPGPLTACGGQYRENGRRMRRGPRSERSVGGPAVPGPAAVRRLASAEQVAQGALGAARAPEPAATRPSEGWIKSQPEPENDT